MNIEYLRNRVKKLMQASQNQELNTFIVIVAPDGTLMFGDTNGEKVFHRWEDGAMYIDTLKQKYGNELTLIIDDIDIHLTNPKLARQWDKFNNDRIRV